MVFDGNKHNCQAITDQNFDRLAVGYEASATFSWVVSKSLEQNNPISIVCCITYYYDFLFYTCLHGLYYKIFYMHVQTYDSRERSIWCDQACDKKLSNIVWRHLHAYKRTYPLLFFCDSVFNSDRIQIQILKDFNRLIILHV